VKSNTLLFRKPASRALSAAALSDSTSRSEFVYQQLRSALSCGALKPGERVMEVDVAEWLAVSRTPVREALRRLENEGLLRLEPRIGLVVASISRQAMLELYVMREVLEGTAARLCAGQATDVEIMELDELVKREQKMQEDFAALARHNRLFHESIHRGAHNRYLEKSLAAVNDTMYLLGPSQMLLPERAKVASSEHLQIFRCIQKHDADGAEAAARQHVRSAQQQRLKQLFPEA
jgi:DNA-binding GntR family transcriptional regulator